MRVHTGLIAGIVCAIASMLTAGAALAFTGTPGGKRLGREMLASYRHVRYLSGSEHGDVFYCSTNTFAGYVEGARGDVPSSCHTHATVSWVNKLSSGKGKSAVGSVVAPGKARITFVATGGGTFFKAKGQACWTKESTDPSFVGSPPFGFFPKEYLRKGPRKGNNVLLYGYQKGLVKETDTINAKSHHIVGEDLHLGSGAHAFHLVTRYHEVSHGPSMPNTSHTC